MATQQPADDPPLAIDIAEGLPPGFPTQPDSAFRSFLSAPQTQLSELARAIERTKRDLQLPHATGRALDVIGWSKGPLGLRRGRGDTEYRQFLRALPNSYGGQYREQDIQRAIAAGVVADDLGDVTLREDVATNSYDVTLHSWQGHSVGLVEFLADYADAPAVALDSITYDWGTSPPRETGSDTAPGTAIDLGVSRPRVGDTGGAWSALEYEDGWGAFEFDSGLRFDVEEPAPREDSIPAERTKHVRTGEVTTIESPFDHDGVLNQDGEVNHD